MRYLAQPYYSANTVEIYSLPGPTMTATLALPHNGPNSVAIWQDPATGAALMFVAYDEGSMGAIDIFDLTMLDLDAGNIAPTAMATLSLGDSAVGLAIQPGTGDLFVATLNLSQGDAGVGVFSYTNASGYAAGSVHQFSSFSDTYNDVAQLCADLVFDVHGNLWMTTFQSGAQNQFLICYTQVDRAAASSGKFFKIANGTTAFNGVTLPGSAQGSPGGLIPFSQPEGLAFDPLGNLWLANNNDDYSTNGQGNGTLMKFSRAWIDTNLLTNAAALANLTADGYGGTQMIASNDPGVTAYYLNGAKFGGLALDGFTLLINDQGNGVVWQMDLLTATLDATSFTTSGINTTYPGNGSMAVFNPAPAALVVRDVAGDTGGQPDSQIVNGVLWESPDIAVTDASILASLPAPNSPSAADTVDFGSDGTISPPTAYAYVRVSNHGEMASTGAEVVKLYFAKASAGLDWPAPWNGLRFDVTASAPPLGGLIGVQPLGVIDGGHETILEFPWTTVPDPTAYSIDDGHFCLLARVESRGVYPFGMNSPEQTDGTAEAAISANTLNNRAIGWRNIAIVPAGQDPNRHRKVRLGVLAANHTDRPRSNRISVQLLNAAGQPDPALGQVVVHADGPSYERMLLTLLEELACWAIGDGRFHLRDIVRGIENLLLHPREVLPLHVEFTPEPGIENYAVRVIQSVNQDGKDIVVGGQTFVVGHVQGFPVR